MLAFDKLGTQRFLVQHLEAVRAEINPAGLGRFGHNINRRTKVSPTIFRIDPRDRKLFQVNAVAFVDVLLARGGINPFGRNLVSRSLNPLPHEINQTGCLGHSHNQSQPGCGRAGAGQHRAGIALNVLKQKSRSTALFVEFCDMAQLQIPIHLGFHPLELAFRFARLDIISQILHFYSFSTVSI